MVPPFVTVRTFCASRVWSEIFRFLKKFAYLYKGSFAWFMNMWKKQISTRVIRMQKKKKFGGNHT